MGRKSSLTSEQWVAIERRHLVDGESINALAIEFGVNESSIRRKIKPNKAEAESRSSLLRVIAERKVKAEAEVKHIAEQIAELPIARQLIVSDLARKLSSISEHLGSAAEYSSASAHRLSLMANQQLERVDEVNPAESAAQLSSFALLQKMANVSSEIGVNLLRANKEAIDDLNKGDRVQAPSGLSHFYGES